MKLNHLYILALASTLIISSCANEEFEDPVSIDVPSQDFVVKDIVKVYFAEGNVAVDLPLGRTDVTYVVNNGYVTITNTLPSFVVNIFKTCEDGRRPLGGAHFKLFGADYYVNDENDDKVLNENPTLIADNLVSDMSTGLIRLGQLGGGEYYLVETVAPDGYLLISEPIHIVVNGASERTKTYDDEPTTRPMYVTYTQDANSLSTSGEGVAISAAALIDGNGAPMVDEEGNSVYNYSYTLTVTNNPGYELPSTGGPGTRLFTIFGSTLILGAGVFLWRTRWLV